MTKTVTMLKKMVRRGANLLDYDITPQWRAASLPMTRCLSKLFLQHAISCVIDVGANKGQFRDYLRSEVEFSGNIISFEPDDRLFAALAERAAREDMNWTVYPHALGAARETRQFHRMRASDFNSFLDPKAGMPANMASLNEIAESYQVEIHTLDELAPQLGDLRHTYVKLDTQGFDLEVIKGGRTALQQVPALQTEISFIPIYSQMPTFAHSIETCKNAGFEVVDMFIVSSDELGRAVEFDCVMKRSIR